MRCPKCGGRALVLRTLHSDDNETYRRFMCEDQYNCSHIFWTVEYEVEYNQKMRRAVNDCELKIKQNREAVKTKGEKL